MSTTILPRSVCAIRLQQAETLQEETMTREQRSGGCGKPGHIGNILDPREGDAATQYCETCNKEANHLPFWSEWGQDKSACEHAPARSDVKLTLCWKCGVEILNDPDIHEERKAKGETEWTHVPIWRPLSPAERLVKYETIRHCHDLFHSVHSSEYARILYEKLYTNDQPSIRLAESVFGRWIIVNGQMEDLAWSGTCWAPHRNGIPTSDVAIFNCATREEAATYAAERFPKSDSGENE